MDQAQDEVWAAPGESGCDVCGGPLVPVRYGYPGAELFDAAERGEVALGGCRRYDGQPRHRCLRCNPRPPETAPALPFRTVAEAYAMRQSGVREAEEGFDGEPPG